MQQRKHAMDDDECIHGLTPTTCGVCRHGVSCPVLVTVEYTFKAKSDGECSSCGLPILVGQSISKLSNERYAHEGCCATCGWQPATTNS